MVSATGKGQPKGQQLKGTGKYQQYAAPANVQQQRPAAAQATAAP